MNFAGLRYALRTLRQSPGFTATAIVTMALGIGATTAIFSLADGMLWKPVPVPHLDTLAMVLQRDPEDPNSFNSVTLGDTADIQAQASSLATLATWNEGLANIVGAGGEPDRVIQYLVSDNFFDVIGVLPAMGRGFRPGENEKGREREVVLSDALWHRRFGADPTIVGRNIRLDDQDYLVTGIAPAKFSFPKAADLWTPYGLTAEARASRKTGGYLAAGRLKPGRTLANFSAELDGIGLRLASQYPDTNRNRRFMTWDGHRFMVGEYNRQYVLMLLGAVLFVLLIACVNLANLQFARATGRLREVAVRTALGASRSRIVMQFVIESILLSFAGALLGLGVAEWSLDLIRGGMPAEIERYIVGWKEIHLDARTMLFTITAALASGLLAGLIPAWQSSRPNLVGALKEGGRTSAGRGRHRLRGVLVAAEVALAVVLLVGASLMVRGFGTLITAATSTEPATLLTFRLALTDAKYPEGHQRRAFYNDVLTRAAAIPGVKSAVAAAAMPFSDHSSSRTYAIEGRPVDPARVTWAMSQTVTPGFFETLHVPLKAGRLLDRRDGPDAPRVAVISERMAQRYWPNEPLPLGKRLRTGGPDSKAEWITIVGVVGDLVHDTFDRNPRPTLYVPYVQDSRLWLDIALRTSGDPSRYANAVTAAVRAADPEQPVADLRPMQTLIRNNAMGLIYVASLMGVFGVLALVLSCVGVYGVMAYVVQEQTHEIGVRMALGAQREGVLAMVLKRGLTTTAIGLGIGLLLAFGLARLMQNLIWGVPATDLVTFTSIPLGLILSAGIAILVPARRATRIDPIVALRYE
jgi:putative ABC transport system permease protein